MCVLETQVEDFVQVKWS